MEPAFDELDARAIVGGVFGMNATLAKIAPDVRIIRLVLEDGD